MGWQEMSLAVTVVNHVLEAHTSLSVPSQYVNSPFDELGSACMYPEGMQLSVCR